MSRTNKIVCRSCFRAFAPFACDFKCVHHDPPLLFSPKRFDRGGWRRKPLYHLAVCPRDSILCSYRVCPACESDIPYYSGRIPSSVMAVAGARTSGKTVYLVALLKYLIEHSAEGFPGLVPMFEDDFSYYWFEEHYRRLAVENQMPEPTPMLTREEENTAPINVRLFRAKRRRTIGSWGAPGGLEFLVFYDPPGELFRSFENVNFVRYLGSAAGIILMLDAARLAQSRSMRGNAPPEPRETSPVGVAEKVAWNVRSELGIDAAEQIQKPLAVLLTKCDASLYREMPALQAAKRDDARLKRGTRAWDAEDRVCQEALEGWGHANAVTFLRNEFAKVRFFTCSALGAPPSDDGLNFSPVGVVEPLLWLIEQKRC